jgi:hypothetical protein
MTSVCLKLAIAADASDAAALTAINDAADPNVVKVVTDRRVRCISRAPHPVSSRAPGSRRRPL